MTVRDDMRELLDVLDGIGVDPQAVTASANDGQNITFRTCDDFAAACKAFRIKEVSSRLNSRAEMRTSDGLRGDLVVAHHCFRHLACWGTKP